MSSSSFVAVVFDIGGVIVSSPFDALYKFEASLGFPHNLLNTAIVFSGPKGAWSLLETGQLKPSEFAVAFKNDVQVLVNRILDGHESRLKKFEPEVRFLEQCGRLDAAVENSGGFLDAIMGGLATARKEYLTAVQRLRAAGFKVAALTNNWHFDTDSSGAPVEPPTNALKPYFDVFVESRNEGIRKPHPDVFKLTCERLGVSPSQAIMVDDIGANLKGAASVGMGTVKVDATNPVAALVKLSELTGVELVRNGDDWAEEANGTLRARL